MGDYFCSWCRKFDTKEHYMVYHDRHELMCSGQAFWKPPKRLGIWGLIKRGWL